MKINRSKKLQKTINFYKNNFGFREPFQILIDATFCQAALKSQVNIKEQLAKYFQAELKLLTTACIIIEAEKLGAKVSKAAYVVKQFPIHKCGHEGNPITGSNCLKEMSKQTRYFIATQDWELQGWIRKRAGQPLCYLHNVTPVLEPPSDASKSIANKKLETQVDVNPYQKNNLNKMKTQAGIKNEDFKPSAFKSKKKKHPNPLSCKKKKKDSKDHSRLVKSGIEKKTKKNIKISKNIREKLNQNKQILMD